ncbi:TetR/AcrR family transcriptional regulator [Pseudarthrobacter sp. CCNWLW247]
MNHSPREQANTAVRDFLSSRDWSAQTPARQRILVAFLTLATARGFGSVTMRTLGRELDMKAPSLYSSFPRGKDEIVAESLSWFTHRFARELLDAAEATTTPEEYWAALVRFHLAQQLQRPEADLWDLLVATDRVARFLSDEVRQEVASWVRLHEDMYAAAAEEMGFRLSRKTTNVIFTLLDGAGRWADWNGSDTDLEILLDHAVALSRSILEVGSGTPALA